MRTTGAASGCVPEPTIENSGTTIASRGPSEPSSSGNSRRLVNRQYSA